MMINTASGLHVICGIIGLNLMFVPIHCSVSANDGTQQGMHGRPPPIPPNPCQANITNAPKFHITNMGTGPHDANAIFRYKGVWHVMHQANWTDWAHLVSTDLVTWTRLPSALSPNGDWDGSLSFVNGEPLIMYDCYNLPDCLPSNASHLGDPPHVGVARPVDPSDPNLTEWKKDSHNPIYFPGMGGGFAGPSNLWKVNDTTNMIMVLGRYVARFESNDTLLHNWTVANPKFLGYGGNDGHGTTGMMFFPLVPSSLPSPSSTSDQYQSNDSPALTHMLGGIWSNNHPAFLVGTPWLVLGSYSASNGTFNNAIDAQPIESSQMVIWSTIGQTDDGRLLHLGWFNYGVGCLTIPRSITYDSRFQKLLAQPIKEIALLRTNIIGHKDDFVVSHGSPLNLFENYKTTSTFDVEFNLTLPMSPHRFGVSVLPSSTSQRLPTSMMMNGINAESSVLLDFNVSTPTKDGVRIVNMSAVVPGTKTAGLNTTTSFLMPTNTPFVLRVVVDRTIVEVFAGNGRGVIATPVVSPPDANTTGLILFAGDDSSTLTVQSSSAWEMGCGWAKYP